MSDWLDNLIQQAKHETVRRVLADVRGAHDGTSE